MPTELQSNSLNLHVEIGEVVTVGDVLADIRCDTSSPNLDVFNSVEKDLFAEHARRGGMQVSKLDVISSRAFG